MGITPIGFLWMEIVGAAICRPRANAVRPYILCQGEIEIVGGDVLDAP